MKNLIKITSNCSEYEEFGLVSKKIKRIIVTWTNEFGFHKEYPCNLDEAYILAFKIGVFDGAKVEITVLFFI